MSANTGITSYAICGQEMSGRKTTLLTKLQVISLFEVPTAKE
jgi:hypothetical protein